MRPQKKHFYEFGPFRLEVNERVLLRGEELVLLTPKVFDTLLVLVKNSGHIVEKDELLQEVWPDTFVEEANVARHVSTLRKVLSGGADDCHYIETVPRRGYRFVANVREVRDDGLDSVAEVRAESNIPLGEKGAAHHPTTSSLTAGPSADGQMAQT